MNFFATVQSQCQIQFVRFPGTEAVRSLKNPLPLSFILVVFALHFFLNLPSFSFAFHSFFQMKKVRALQEKSQELDNRLRDWEQATMALNAEMSALNAEMSAFTEEMSAAEMSALSAEMSALTEEMSAAEMSAAETFHVKWAALFQKGKKMQKKYRKLSKLGRELQKMRFDNMKETMKMQSKALNALAACLKEKEKLLEVKEKLLDEMDAAQTDGHESR
jgi:hypothetical protein